MNELVQILKNTRQHLMTGVSHMIPFVVSGGILLAVSVMLYGKGAVPDAATDPNLKKLFDIGVAGLTLMVPFLAAYIGYSISDRAALAPCAIGAWVGNSFGAGFFGALIAGMIGGLVVYYLKKIPVHKVLRSVMPIFIIPIVGTFITAGIMMWGLGEPVGALTANLTGWLQQVQPDGLLRWRPSLLSVSQGMQLWLEHLVYCASGGTGESRLFVRKEGEWRFPALAPAEAQAYLNALVDGYLLGMSQPLLLLPESGGAWLKACYDAEKDVILMDEETQQKARSKFLQTYEGNMVVSGEGADIWYQRLWRSLEPAHYEEIIAQTQRYLLPLYRYHQSTQI